MKKRNNRLRFRTWLPPTILLLVLFYPDNLAGEEQKDNQPKKPSSTVAVCRKPNRKKPAGPLGTRRTWRTVRAKKYTAQIDGVGRMRLLLNDKPFLDCQYLQRWNIRQDKPYVKNIIGQAETTSGNRSVTLTFSYDWNQGHVRERLAFTCRDIRIQYEYTARTRIMIRNFAYLFAFKKPPPKAMQTVSGFYDSKDGALSRWPKWKPPRQRLTFLCLRNLHDLQIDFVTSTDAWFVLWDKRRLGLMDAGRFWQRGELKAGEVHRLSCLIRFTDAGGRNLPDTPVRMDPGVGRAKGKRQKGKIKKKKTNPASPEP